MATKADFRIVRLILLMIHVQDSRFHVVGNRRRHGRVVTRDHERLTAPLGTKLQAGKLRIIATAARLPGGDCWRRPQDVAFL
jgi:hypothetical protein